MTRKEMLLLLLMEECNEVSQRVSKALRFGLDECEPGDHMNNSDRILQEFNDLQTIIAMLIEEGILVGQSYVEIHQQVEEKRKKVEKYLLYSKECGTLKDEI